MAVTVIDADLDVVGVQAVIEPKRNKLRPSECWTDAGSVAKHAVAVDIPGIGEGAKDVGIMGAGPAERQWPALGYRVRPARAGGGRLVKNKLEGTDVHRAVDDAGVSSPALVGADAGGDEAFTAGIDGRAAGQEGHRFGRPAVVL